MAVDVTYSAATGAAIYAGRLSPVAGAIATLLGSLSSPVWSVTAGGQSPVVIAPTGSIPQYLTSDGGSADAGSNCSGPTRDKWHNRMGFGWLRPNLMGNWLDANQTAEGSVAYATAAPITTVGQVVSLSATALVSRWLNTGQNRGAYLAIVSGSLFPVAFHGRTDATDALRPRLTVETSTGTVVLTAACNATWNISSFTAAGSAIEWRLSSGQQPAILRFDLGALTGTLISASLAFTVKSFPTGGSTGQVVGMFEADPPVIVDPVSVPTPAAGMLTSYANFNAFKAAGLPTVLLADDFESPGPFDTGYSVAPTRVLNPDTGTTYVRAQIPAGGGSGYGTPSLDINKAVSQGTGPGGAPDVVYEELYGHYAWYMESDFGTTQADAIKIPAMGVQFGYWVVNPPSGYWQQTTGNGGSPGTGLKRDDHVSGNFNYEGHSVRLLTGTAPKAGDDDPYAAWFGIGIYPYNLDQGGPFPAGEPFPWVALRREAWYDFDIRVRQNTMSGDQTALGNYATANPDGVFQVWINGYLSYTKSTYRWRKHPEFGVQGLWLDVYHGGTSPALVDMHYRLDRIVIATQFIGPPPIVQAAWPFSLPASGAIASLGGNVPDAFEPAGASQFHIRKVIGAWGTGAVSVIRSGQVVTDILYWLHGGGHGDTGWDGVLVWRASTGLWEQALAPSRADPVPISSWDTTNGEDFSDGRPISTHLYQHAYGLDSDEGPGPALIQARKFAAGQQAITVGQGHRFAWPAKTWSRWGNNPGNGDGGMVGGASAYIKDTLRKRLVRIPSDNQNTWAWADYTKNDGDVLWNPATQPYRTGLGWSNVSTAVGVYDPVRDLYLCGALAQHLRAVRADAVSTSTWALLTLTGVALPTNMLGCGWQYRPVADEFLLVDTSTLPPTGVFVLTPPAAPASGLAGTWTVSRRAFTGTSQYQQYTNDKTDYNRWQYVAALDALIVCPRHDAAMEVWKL